MLCVYFVSENIFLTICSFFAVPSFRLCGFRGGGGGGRGGGGGGGGGSGCDESELSAGLFGSLCDFLLNAVID